MFNMSHDIIKVSRNTPNAPQSAQATQTVAFSHYNNISAQLPVNPNTGDIVVGNIKAQAKQCLTNIKAIVESIGHVMDDMALHWHFTRLWASYVPLCLLYQVIIDRYMQALLSANHEDDRIHM